MISLVAFAALEFPCCAVQICAVTIARMAAPEPIADVTRYEWDPALTKVLLDSKGVIVKKFSDFLCAFADEKDPSINRLRCPSCDVAGQQIAPSHHRAQEG